MMYKTKVLENKILNIIYGFYLSTFILFNSINVFSTNHTFHQVYKFIALVCILALFTFFLIVKKTYSYLIISIGILGISIIAGIKNDGINLILTTAFFIVCSKYQNEDDIVKIDFYIRTTMTVLIMLLSCLKIFNNVIIYRDNGVRNSFGFNHPNTTGAMIFLIILDILYILYKKNRKLGLVGLVSLIFIVLMEDKLINARSAEFGSIIAIFGFYVIQHFKKKRNIDRILAIIAVLSCTLLPMTSLFLAFNYDITNNFYVHIDNLMSSRLYFFSYLLKYYPFSWFGQLTPLIGAKLTPFATTGLSTDNVYIEFYMRFGIIPSLLYLSLLLFGLLKSINNKNYMMFVWIESTMIWACSESLLYIAAFNLPFIVLFANNKLKWKAKRNI